MGNTLKKLFKEKEKYSLFWCCWARKQAFIVFNNGIYCWSTI